jgi:signal transduction histidine kinase
VGLGLYIARRSLERMGGEIWCTDSPSGGASFGFTLPICSTASTASTASTEHASLRR